MTDVKTNAFVEAIKNINPYSLKENEILTENGAIQLKSSGSNIVDQFGKAGNYRGRSIDDVWDEQNEIWNENSEAALRFPFYLRMITRKVKSTIRTLLIRHRVDKEHVMNHSRDFYGLQKHILMTSIRTFSCYLWLVHGKTCGY